MDLNEPPNNDSTNQSSQLGSELSQQPTPSYPVNLDFKLPDGTHKSVTRTDKLLGEGGQALVYYANDDSGLEYVIKIIDLSKYPKNSWKVRIKDFENELVLLRKINSQNIIKFYGHFSEPDDSCHYLLLEYCNCDLYKVLKQRNSRYKSWCLL